MYMNRLSSEEIHFILILCVGKEGNEYLMLQLRPEEGVGGPGAEMKGM